MDANQNGLLDPFEIVGDIDVDGDVDRADVAKFVRCLGGPSATFPPPDCESWFDFHTADLSIDSIVDLVDAAAFQNAFAGP